jgi:glycogen debranching enzyme
MVIHEGYTYLLGRMDGTVGQDPQEGLYDYDTRILSRHVLRVLDQEPIGVGWVSTTGERWQGMLRVDRPGGDAEGPALRQDAIEIRIERRVGCGMLETVTLVNRSMAPVETELELELGADFLDLLEQGGERRVDGSIEADWRPDEGRLEYRFRAEHEGRSVERAVRMSFEGWQAPAVTEIEPTDVAGPVRWHRVRQPLQLGPHAECRLVLRYESLVDGEWRSPSEERQAARDDARGRRPTIECSGDVVRQTYEAAADDLIALRNWDLESSDDEWLLNAGVPVFTGFFGRDSLTASFQAAMLGPEFMRGALAWAARTQATEHDEFTEAQPGRMVHEMRRGPISELGIRPHAAYYGSSTTGSMFVLALAELWHWAGDEEDVRRFLGPARRAIEWAERDGDLDGDGLVEYVQRSPEGLKNQGWKDSDEAIRYPDGRIVENPIATIDEQAFHYIALQRLAELELVLGDEAAARRWLERARRLRADVVERFWMEDEGFFAIALDPEKRQVRTIASNPIHALGSGLVPADKARRVVDRLLEPDLWNGWGVRTLSAQHPSYNPFAYHLGAVWPVESGTFAVGAKRYGFADAVEQIATGLLTAAGHCHRMRLPEVLAGHGQDISEVPVIYPFSKSPQAWSASATIQVLQVLLGIQPYASADLLALIRPSLPPWLPALTLRGLRVGQAVVDLAFERQDDGSAAYESTVQEGTLRVLEMPPPDPVDPDGSVQELTARWLLEHVPGRSREAMRIAMGSDDVLR